MKLDVRGLKVDIDDDLMEKYLTLFYPSVDLHALTEEGYNYIQNFLEMFLSQKACANIPEIQIDVERQTFSSQPKYFPESAVSDVTASELNEYINIMMKESVGMYSRIRIKKK